jgi:hypothetical protein
MNPDEAKRAQLYICMSSYEGLVTDRWGSSLQSLQQ